MEVGLFQRLVVDRWHLHTGEFEVLVLIRQELQISAHRVGI